MVRLHADTPGFSRSEDPVASPCLLRAVAATLVFAALSLCLSVAITAFSIKVSMATPALG